MKLINIWRKTSKKEHDNFKLKYNQWMKTEEEQEIFYTEGYVKGKLIDREITIENYKSKEIDLEKLVNLLEKGVTTISHRCISVYRHAFIFKGDVYNICLSCGDFYKNNDHFYINNKEEIENYIKNI